MQTKTSQSLLEPGRDGAPPPDLPYLPGLSGLNFAPVFILGEERSGTTILYKMLSRSESFNIVTLYHILCYDELLAAHAQGTEQAAKERLNAYLAARGLDKRFVDAMPVNADLPEEYRLRFPIGGLRDYLCRATLGCFEELCRKVQATGGPDRPLLLKSPGDTARFLYIRRVYPHARFVFIDRHPIDRLNSKMSMVHNCLDEGNPYVELIFPPLAWARKTRLTTWIARWLNSQGGLARQSRKVRQTVRRLLPQLPAEAYVRLRYEDLCREPQRQIGAIFDFLGVVPRATVDYATLIARRPRCWLPEIERSKDRLCRLFGCGLEEDDYR